nr:hypothetical protein [Tanacetum cinerariifolium]
EDDITDYVAFIDNTLNECPTDLNLKKFKLSINYGNWAKYEFKSRANSGIRYAISRNVEEIDLWLWDEDILDDDMIEKILSGSPCLESLELIDCYGYTRIDVTSKSVKKLVFSEHYSDDELFEKD